MGRVEVIGHFIAPKMLLPSTHQNHGHWWLAAEWTCSPAELTAQKLLCWRFLPGKRNVMATMGKNPWSKRCWLMVQNPDHWYMLKQASMMFSCWLLANLTCYNQLQPSLLWRRQSVLIILSRHTWVHPCSWDWENKWLNGSTVYY